MNPILKLGPYDSPSIEFDRSEIYPIVSLMVETNHPLSSLDLNHVVSFVQLDTLFLDDESLSFFLMLEDTSKRIVTRDLTRFIVTENLPAELGGIPDLYQSDGPISQRSKLAAKRILEFFERYPDLWPRH